MTVVGNQLGVAMLVAALVLGGATAGAQGAPPASPLSLETRETLEARAVDAEQQGRSAEAFLLKARLQRGDFQEGDRIVVSLLGATTFNDTITVRAGKVLPLPRMGDVPLEGVLRSELTSRVSSHLARFLRDSSVRATPLVRLAVLGQVRSPGFYFYSADMLLSDVLMRAGGPSAEADLGKLEIRRGGEEIWDEKSTSAALADGLSLDRLHLRAGDEIHVGQRRRLNWAQYLQVGLGLVGAVAAFAALR